TLYEPDGRATVLDDVDNSQYNGFWGEDFYYLTRASTLMRVPAGGTPAQVATGVVHYFGYLTPDGVLLTLYRAHTDPDLQQISLRAPITGQETVVAGGDPRFFVDLELSPDGRTLLISDTGARHFTFFDVPSGAQQVIAFPDDLELLTSF